MKKYILGIITVFAINYTLTAYRELSEEHWSTIYSFQQRVLLGNYITDPLIRGVCDDKPMENGHGWKIHNRGEYFECDKFQRLINNSKGKQ